MGVMANVKGKLGDLWYRLKAWAHSVPPDVWIGLAIAAATLIVVWLAYKKAGGSSVSGTDTGIPIDNLPVSGGSSSNGSNDTLPTIPILDWGPNKLPGNPSIVKPTAGTPDVGLNAALQNIYNQNESNGQNATIAAFQRQQAATMAYYNSAFPDESTIARAIQKPIATLTPSAPNHDESTIAKIIQKVKPQPSYSPAPVRPHPFAINPTPTGRGVDIAF